MACMRRPDLRRLSCAPSAHQPGFQKPAVPAHLFQIAVLRVLNLTDFVEFLFSSWSEQVNFSF